MNTYTSRRTTCVMAFAEKDCNEGEVFEICTMEELEKELPRNWIPECKRQERND